MEQKERFKLVPAVYLVLVREGKILLARRLRTGYEDGKYSMVAGHVDGGETMREALVREAQEEAGIRIEPDQLKHALTMHRWCGDHERVDLFFTAERWAGEIRNMEPDKCDDLAWFPLDGMPDNVIPYVREAIACYRKGETYCEFGWEKR